MVITHLMYVCMHSLLFSSPTENNEFITSCQTNRMFLSKNLSVRPLEVTAKVKVEDVSNINLDILQLYLENEGWEVEQITPDEEEQSAIICFKMDTGIATLLAEDSYFKVVVRVYCVGCSGEPEHTSDQLSTMAADYNTKNS